MTEFDGVWQRVKACAGQEFRTVRGLPFTYKVVHDSAVVPDRTDYPIAQSDFEKAFGLMPLNGPGEINQIVRGPAYVYAILADTRTRV